MECKYDKVSVDLARLCYLRRQQTNSGISISRTSMGNKNWFEISGVKTNPRETTFGSSYRGFDKKRFREIGICLCIVNIWWWDHIKC